MAQIVINEISDNYSYSIANNSFATIAMPITSSWGPGYFDPETFYGDDLYCKGTKIEYMLDNTMWRRYPATQAGLESFVSDYRGPMTNYRLAKDYSYQMAMTYMTAGYDVLVCRMCSGARAEQTFYQLPKPNGNPQMDFDPEEVFDLEERDITFKAKYPGSFGNNIRISVRLQSYYDRYEKKNKLYWNVITYIVDSSGVQTSAENKSFVFENANATDTILFYEEIESKFWEITHVGSKVNDSYEDFYYDADGTKVTEDSSGNPITDRPTSVYTFDKIEVREKVTDSDTGKTSYVKKEKYVYRSASLLIGGSDYVDFLKEAEGDTEEERKINANKLIILGDRINKKDKDGEEIPDSYDDNQGTNHVIPSISMLAKRRYNWKDYYLEDYSEVFSKSKSYPELIDKAIRSQSFKSFEVYCEENGIPTSTEEEIEAARKTYEEAISSEESGDNFVNYKDIFSLLYAREWIYSSLVGLYAKADESNGFTEKIYNGVFDLLTDKLSYNPNRVMASGWDDQDYYMYEITDKEIYDNFEGWDCDTCPIDVSPFHVKLMDVSYHSRCATGMLDIPKCLDRRFVYIEDEYDLNRYGYAQALARCVPRNIVNDVDGSLFTTHSALYVPWGQYTYVGVQSMAIAPPSFLAEIIHRAQILNQAAQYEWILPTNRKHNLKIGKLDYNVPKKLLDEWQKLEGVGVNIITTIPDLGINVWGNSTLYEVPPATYQALANLSTRWLVNAIEDVVYRVGTSITYTYNNDEAYASFYAGCVPILDTMKMQGAIEDYVIKVSDDLNGLDRVNYNTVLGKIWITPYGVVNDIIVDLIALPPHTDLSQFRG